MAERDEVMPAGKWEFDQEVTDAFSDMLQRSIPQYGVMRRAVFELACKYAQDKTAIVDLGCSRGDALAAIVDARGAYHRYVACDVSEPMLHACRERFAGYIKSSIVSVRHCDLRHTHPPEMASVTTMVLTLQFTPIEHRQAILRRCFKHTLPGGCLIVVEKVLGATADIDATMVELYLASKVAAGYTQEQIDRKKLSLEGVLVPVTASWNEELLRQAGYQQVDCFWRFLNFAGWIAVKD